MDKEIEKKVKLPTVCQNVRSSPLSAPSIPWKWATRPFQHIHIDFCQKGHDQFLVVIDNSHSRWLEVRHMSSTTKWATEWAIDSEVMRARGIIVLVKFN